MTSLPVPLGTTRSAISTVGPSLVRDVTIWSARWLFDGAISPDLTCSPFQFSFIVRWGELGVEVRRQWIRGLVIWELGGDDGSLMRAISAK